MLPFVLVHFLRKESVRDIVTFVILDFGKEILREEFPIVLCVFV